MYSVYATCILYMRARVWCCICCNVFALCFWLIPSFIAALPRSLHHCIFFFSRSRASFAFGFTSSAFNRTFIIFRDTSIRPMIWIFDYYFSSSNIDLMSSASPFDLCFMYLPFLIHYNINVFACVCFIVVAGGVWLLFLLHLFYCAFAALLRAPPYFCSHHTECATG